MKNYKNLFYFQFTNFFTDQNKYRYIDKDFSFLMKVFFLRFGKERELGCEQDKQDNEKLQEFVLFLVYKFSY